MSLLPMVRRRARLAAAFLLAVALAVFALPGPSMAAAASAAATTVAKGAVTKAAATAEPCDIYASGGTPCEAAYSMTRALFSAYDGPLYQIKRASDSSTLNIGLESAGGAVNSAPQVSFCSGTTCTITELYDQTTNGNNMPISLGTSCSGCSSGISGPGPNGSDIGSPAMALPVTVDGQPAYGALFDAQGTGYRIDNAKNVPTGSQPEGVYMMTSSNLTSGSCCFDFGSGESNNSDDGDSTMNAIYYGTDCWTQNCTGPGPWVGGDIENGMYFSNTGANPPTIPSENGTFVSAWEKNNGTTNFTLKYGNGQQGGLTETYSGPLPNGYNPMKVQNSIELGTGGDNSIWGDGEFFEGAVTAGDPTDTTENAVQANMVAAGYTFPTQTGQPYGGTAAAVPGTVQAANYDTGGLGVGFTVNPVQGSNDSYRTDGADMETTSDTLDTTGAGAPYDIGWTGTGQWYRYTVNVATAGTYTVSLRLASPNAITDGLHIANGSGANLSGPVNVPSTGGFQDWTTVTTTVTLPAGVQTLKIAQDNGGWNIHYLTFALSQAAYGGAVSLPGTVQAANYNTGGQGVAYNVTSVNGGANGYRSDGVDLETTSDTQDTTGAGAPEDLGWTSSGQWFTYTVNVTTPGTYTVRLRVAAPSAVADAFHIDNSSGTNLSGDVAIASTGGWQDWTTISANVTLPYAGLQTLTVDQDASGWNLHFLTFALGEQPFTTAVAVPGTVQAANYDTGGQGLAYNVSSVNGGADSYRSDGVDLETTSDTQDTTGAGAPEDLGWSAPAQWFRYTVSVATAGTYTVSMRVAAPSAVTDAFHLANSSGTNLSGNVNLPATGGFQTWTTVTANVTLPAGTQTLTLDEDNGSWNIHDLALAAS
jgi:Alpha-L-arabinofuranosidase B, catalytic/Carbohydrate binding module (family 6)